MAASNDNLSIDIILPPSLYIGHPIPPDFSWGVALLARLAGNEAGKRGTLGTDTEIISVFRLFRVFIVFPVGPKAPRPDGRISSVVAVCLEETLKIYRTASEWFASEFRRPPMRLSLVIAVSVPKVYWELTDPISCNDQ